MWRLLGTQGAGLPLPASICCLVGGEGPRRRGAAPAAAPATATAAPLWCVAALSAAAAPPAEAAPAAAAAPFRTPLADAALRWWRHGDSSPSPTVTPEAAVARGWRC